MPKDVDPAPSTLGRNLAMERHAHGAKKESGILVSSGAGVDGNVATRNHLGGIPMATG